MNPSTQNDSATNENARAEETLRLIATLPAPAGLEDRIKSRLESAPRTGQVLFWPSAHKGGGGWVRSSTVRAAAAAAIVFVVAGWRMGRLFARATADAAQGDCDAAAGQRSGRILKRWSNAHAANAEWSGGHASSNGRYGR